MTNLRFLAVKVASDMPNRYRLIGLARDDERTDSATVPQRLVLLLSSDDAWRSVISLSRGGLTGKLMTNVFGIAVEE